MFYADEVMGGRAFIGGETAQHMRKVLRAERGQVYEISDGEGVWLGRLVDVGREGLEFELTERLRREEAPARVHLLASLIKFDRFEWMIEKATELGVSRITPVCSIRSERGLAVAAAKRMERWEKIVKEAGQQSRRVRPPELGEVVELGAALTVGEEVRLWLEEERGVAGILDEVGGEGPGVAVMVGPEGGWDEREREGAERAKWKRVTLGPLILRAETAAVAAVAVVMAEMERRGRSKSPGL